MADGVTYRSVHPDQVLDDQSEGRLGSMSHAERQVFEPRPFWKWWWQEGPVDKCCCCFSLRTGIMLLSLDNLVSAMPKLFVGNIASSQLTLLEQKFTYVCLEGGDSAACKKLVKSEAENELLLSYAALFSMVGVVLMIVSVIGFRAACMKDSKSAKLYMKTYPFLMVFSLVMVMMRVVMAPSTITEPVQVAIGVDMFLIPYYCKVTWSFYKRRKIMEDMQLTSDASSPGHVSMVQTSTVV